MSCVWQPNTKNAVFDSGQNVVIYIWRNMTHISKEEVKWSEVTQSCPTLCDPMDHSPPGSSVRGILQARILEWVAISFSRRSSPPKDWTCVSGIGRQILYHWATWEVPFLLPWAYNLIACTLANRKVEELAYIGSFFLVNKALLASQLVSPLSSTPPPIPPTCCA